MELGSETRHGFLDFFAGSGLVTEGLKQRFQALWANDICASKAKVYQANHAKDHFYLGSIENVRGWDLPKASLAWASFPCQDLSLAGKQSGIDGARSGLVWQWLRILKEMPEKPPVLVAENVVGLIAASGGEHYRALHKALASQGYRVGAIVLDAARWVPQSRPRVFVIAVDQEVALAGLTGMAPNWLHPKAIKIAAAGLEDFVWWSMAVPSPRKLQLPDLIDFAAPCDSNEKSQKNLSLIPEKHLQLLLRAGSLLTVAPGYKRTRNGRQVLELRFDGLAGCLRTPGGGSSRQYLIIPRENRIETRLFTIREAARLMGAPDNYYLPGTTDRFCIEGGYNEGYKAMGDAVAVPVARYLAENLLAALVTRSGSKRAVLAA
ncbi:MAG: DNA cytosine methyltransferase [Desulfuromonadales bacterium]